MVELLGLVDQVVNLLILERMGKERGKRADHSHRNCRARTQPGSDRNSRFDGDGDIRTRENSQVLHRPQNNRSNWMVGGKRGEFGLQANDGSVNPDAGLSRVGYVHFHLHLIDWHGQRRATVDDCMFAKENDLAGCGSFHER